MSLKLAIEQLGLGPCHHMTELFTHFHLVALWERAFDGTLGDFEEIFKDYAATTDEPAAIMWERHPRTDHDRLSSGSARLRGSLGGGAAFCPGIESDLARRTENSAQECLWLVRAR